MFPYDQNKNRPNQILQVVSSAEHLRCPETQGFQQGGVLQVREVPREAVDAPCLEVFKAQLDGASANLIWWVASLPTAGGWSWGSFEVPSNPSLSVLLWLDEGKESSKQKKELPTPATRLWQLQGSTKSCGTQPLCPSSDPQRLCSTHCPGSAVCTQCLQGKDRQRNTEITSRSNRELSKYTLYMLVKLRDPTQAHKQQREQFPTGKHCR